MRCFWASVNGHWRTVSHLSSCNNAQITSSTEIDEHRFVGHSLRQPQRQSSSKKKPPLGSLTGEVAGKPRPRTKGAHCCCAIMRSAAVVLVVLPLVGCAAAGPAITGLATAGVAGTVGSATGSALAGIAAGVAVSYGVD